MKLFHQLIFLLATFTAFAQSGDTDNPDFYGMTISEVSKISGWTIIKENSGNLSSAHLEDIVVILQSGEHQFINCSESAQRLADEKRIILVLTAGNDDDDDDDDEPKVSIQNNRFIAPPISGGMDCYLEPEVSIENHTLSISYQYVRSSTSYTFNFIDESLVLVSAKKAGVSGGVFSSDYFDFKSGKITSKKGSISSDSTTIETIPIEFEGFKKLSEMGEMYEWEVAEFKRI
ncbi:MAG: hypothetical protein LAT67_02700 [Balneolales bacterium]|nr:hypothetical protein [Balneolales bacterium]